MIKNRFLAAVTAVLAGVSIVSCDMLQEVIDSIAEVSISSENEAFDAKGEAVVTISLNVPSTKAVNVIIGLSTEAEEGFTAVDSASLDFDGSVTIPAQEVSVSVPVKLKGAAEPGQEAVIIIASAEGANVGKNSVVYIKVPEKGYNGEDIGESGEEEAKVVASISAVSEVFDGNGEAVVKVSLNQASDKEVSVVLAISDKAEEGYTAIGAMALAFEPDTVVIPAGEVEASAKISVVLDAVEEGQEAVIAIARAEGAEVAENSVVYIKVPEKQEQSNPSLLNWTIKYLGCSWVEGYYSYGQLESFEVSNTDTQKYYYPIIINLAEDEDYTVAIEANADAFFATLQEEIEDDIADTIEFYAYFGYTISRQEAIAMTYYNEINDGSVIFFDGLPAGNFKFLVISMDSDAKLDKCYSVIEFQKTEDAITDYDWNLNPVVNPEWTAVWDGWEEGWEGDYYWFKGNASGAKYVYYDSYTQEELDYYLDGDIANLVNSIQTEVKDALAFAGTLDEALEDNEDYTLVEADGSFIGNLSTYDLVGETTVYVIGIDANGNVLSGYGASVIDIPEYEPEPEEPVEWVEKEGWAVNYDATVDTGEADYPQAIVASACDASYFIIYLDQAGALDEEGIDSIGRGACSTIQKYVGYGYTIDELVEYGVVFNKVPAVTAYSGVYNGVEAFLFGVDANGKPTGEWHMETITGIEEIPVEPIEWVEKKDWVINYDGSVDTGEADYPQALVVSVCDAPYFITAVWGSGDLEAEGIDAIGREETSTIQKYLSWGYTIDQLVSYGVVYDKVPAVGAWTGLENDLEAFIIAIDETGAPTGGWHMEPLVGIETEIQPAMAKHKVVVSKPVLKSTKPALVKKARPAASHKDKTFKAAKNTKQMPKSKKIVVK